MSAEALMLSICIIYLSRASKNKHGLSSWQSTLELIAISAVVTLVCFILSLGKAMVTPEEREAAKLLSPQERSRAAWKNVINRAHEQPEFICIQCSAKFKNEKGSKRIKRSTYCSDRCRLNHADFLRSIGNGH